MDTKTPNLAELNMTDIVKLYERAIQSGDVVAISSMQDALSQARKVSASFAAVAGAEAMAFERIKE